MWTIYAVGAIPALSRWRRAAGARTIESQPLCPEMIACFGVEELDIGCVDGKVGAGAPPY
jgi:hypothetical protein